MTRKYKLSVIFIFIFFSISLQTLSAAQNQTEWIIAAQKFTFTRNQTGSVADGIAEMFPARILEKLSSNLYRTVLTDENAERELYKIRQERNSLFLQLSSEVKKRDSLVLKNYGTKELEIQISKEDIKINEIKQKLSENLERQKELLLHLEQQYQNNGQITQGTTKAFFKSLFFEQKEESSQEKISLYRNDISSLYSTSGNAITTAEFEKQVVDAKINCLINGEITAFDEYLSLTVKARIFPGGKEIAVISEIGSVDDADIIASAIANQLAPTITNSMPSVLVINLETQEAAQNLKLYIDDVLYTDIDSEFTIDSGVHFIQFTSQGYKNAGTNYFFEGNKKYEINVSLEKIETKTIFIAPKATISGDILANGITSTKLTDNASKITINGNAVLAQFITQENGNAFIYIPENKVVDGVLYTVKLKPVNHNDYIEKRRRGMYFSYSMLVTSLMPTLITKGVVESYRTMLGDTKKMEKIDNLKEKIDTANKWVLASRISTGVSIACGVWFVFELYRYFNAANSVLPVSTKMEFDYTPAPELIKEEIKTEETQKDTISETIDENIESKEVDNEKDIR